MGKRKKIQSGGSDARARALDANAPGSPHRYSRLLIGLGLVLVTTAAYSRVFKNGFVLYDDKGYVTENRHIQEGPTPKALRWALTATYAANWHPLTWISHMIDWRLFGLNPTGHHLTGLLLHLANTVLLFLALLEMTSALWRSAFVAALFALHPMHVESVAWVAERKDVLSTLFWMLALLAYTRYVRAPARKTYLWVTLLFILGLLAKPMVVTLPFVLLLLDYWPLGRNSQELTKTAGPISRWQGPVREKLPLFALAVASSALTFFAQHRGGAVQTLEGIPLGQRIGNALVSYIGYVTKTVWPRNLAVFYPHPFDTLAWWQVAGALLLLCATTWLVVRAAEKHPYLPVGWFWYLGTLVPVIGLVQVGEQSMADRYSYIPSIGLFIVTAWGVPEILAKSNHRQTTLALSSVAVICASAVLTWFQVASWRDSLTLFEHASQVVPNNYLAQNNLGFALAADGRLDEAMAHYSEALRIKSRYAEAHNNLANALVAKGKVDEGIAHYNEALRIRPRFFQAHNNLGAVLFTQRRVDEALAHYSEALRIQPDQPEAENKLAMKLAALGRIDEAIHHFSEALRLNPASAEYHNNLALVLGAAGKTAQAGEHYLEALRIKPDYPEAHVNLGVALAREGKASEGIEHYKRALQIRPDYPDAHINLGIELAGQGKIDEAIRHFTEAASIKPDSAEAHYNLGKAYLVAGNRSASIEELKILKPLNARLADDLTYLINR